MADFIKSKTFVSVLLMGVAAFIIGGATMAWFTSDAKLEAAEFKAGTVEIMVEDSEETGIKMPEGKDFENVNPGDCATIVWEFVNKGTKAVQLKVNLTEEWSKRGLDVGNVYLCPTDPVDGKGWVIGECEDSGKNGDIWLYYIDRSTGELGSIRGTYNPENPEEPLDPEKVELKLVVVFDAEGIVNKYQGATYTLGGGDSKVYAIQASNGAPEAVWPMWQDVTKENYVPDLMNEAAWENFDYFHNGNPGMLTECWIRANGGEYDPEEPEAGSIVTFEAHLVAAAPGNQGNNHTDTRINGWIKNAKDADGNLFTGWVDVTFKVYDANDGTKFKEVKKTLYLQNGGVNFAHLSPSIIVTDIYTRNNDDISITIDGITWPE